MRRVVAPVNARPVQRRTPDLPGRVIVGRTPPTRWNVPAAGRARWWCARSRTAPNQFGFASGFAERRVAWRGLVLGLFPFLAESFIGVSCRGDQSPGCHPWRLLSHPATLASGGVGAVGV